MSYDDASGVCRYSVFNGNTDHPAVMAFVPLSRDLPSGSHVLRFDYPQCTPEAYAVVDGAGFNLVSSSDYDGYTNEALTGGLLDDTSLRMVVATSGRCASGRCRWRILAVR